MMIAGEAGLVLRFLRFGLGIGKENQGVGWGTVALAGASSKINQ
jgi:hypothetical protein